MAAKTKSPAKKTSSKSGSKSGPKSLVKRAAKKTVGKKVLAKPKSAAKPKIAKKKTTAAKTSKTSKTSVTVYKLKAGDRCPAFVAVSTSGQNVNQGAHKRFVLYFYPKDNTPGCTLEGQDFRKLYKQFQNANAEIIGVSQDSVKSHEKFKSKCDFPFELLSDESGDVCKAFDVIQKKSMYGRDFDGIERSTFLIDDGKIVKEWRKLKVNGHAKDVLDAVKAL